MSNIYSETTWINDAAPAISGTNLNNIEKGISTNNKSILTITHNITTDADYILTVEQNLYGRVIITDTGTLLTVARNITVNTSVREFIVKNSTAQILTFKTSAGTGIAVAVGATVALYCDGTNIIESIDISRGKILQAVSVTKDDTFTTTSTSFVDITGLVATITPTSTDSKILVLVECYLSNTSAASRAYTNLDRNGTAIGLGAAASLRTSCFSFFRAGSIDDMDNAGGNFLDSPASASALTYKLQLSAEAGTAVLNRDGSDADASIRPRVTSSITLLEIGV